mmetsp:Transcript_21374/g.30953  ORF Transcript_21374/g.30953 Transcript_21374/m.30953 type:complete len:346 (-) Transcript_21374:151-1188(-)
MFTPVPLAESPFTKRPGSSGGGKKRSSPRPAVKINDLPNSNTSPNNSARRASYISNDSAEPGSMISSGGGVLLGDDDEKEDASLPEPKKSVDPFIWSLFNMDTDPRTSVTDDTRASTSNIDVVVPTRKSVGKLFEQTSNLESVGKSDSASTYRGAFEQAVDIGGDASKVRRFSFKRTASTESYSRKSSEKTGKKNLFALSRMLSLSDDSDSNQGSAESESDYPLESVSVECSTSTADVKQEDERKSEKLSATSGSEKEMDERSKRRMSRLRRLFSWGSVEGDEEFEISVRSPHPSSTKPKAPCGDKFAREFERPVKGIAVNTKRHEMAGTGLALPLEHDFTSTED